MPLYVQLDRFLYSKLSLETAVSILTQSHIPKLSRIHLKLQAYDYSGNYLCYDELAVLTYLEQLDWGIFNQVIDSPSLPSKNSLVLEARGATLLISVMRGSAGHYGKGLGESLREIVKERLPLRAYAAVEII
ncbi:hypothetical protein PHLCEN_2v4410 [Hermanssonia centrifuga]|uniref:Uncharacterized protein n=1 Tax=Hermanssonia centrifuga TaxID=98765 RepID=A0A2R6PNN6_9APHY|nr:hypothetical protein PHLCEN_2v4410 [Hermanssonia centrifuga]